MKQTIQKIALSTVLLGSSVFATTLTTTTPVMAQRAFPITQIVFNVGGINSLVGAKFVVPDTNTTVDAGGGLRRYDAHIAKMFELTLYECQESNLSNADGYAWHYRAGGGDIDMGVFGISCGLARNVSAAYGLGRPERTEIWYYRVDTVADVPTFSIVGGKVPTWRRFVQNFKPQQY